MGYYDTLPPSFGSQVFSSTDNAKLSSFNFASTYDSKFQGPFGVDTAGQFNSVIENLSGTGALSSSGWTFITAPQNISWDLANQANRVDIFGTNNPPVVSGTRGMRDLKLSEALVEGFVRGVTVEKKVAALENLMSYSLNSSDGFVSVPVYQVWANSKSYGGSEAYYIIRDISVKETMRDIRGDATRALVDISLMQVPAYQVNSGRDQASPTTAGAVALPRQTVANGANQKVVGKGGSTAKTAGAKAASGPTSASAAKPATGSSATTSTRAGLTASDPSQPLQLNARPGG
jgi:hypothetical protein